MGRCDAHSAADFQVAIELAFAAWEVVDPATGLGTDLRFVPDLGTWSWARYFQTLLRTEPI